MFMKTILRVANLSFALACAALSTGASAKVTVRAQILGGHERKSVDHGRPVILIAAALRVREQVFRDAFSHVRPGSAGQEPDPEHVIRNKQALLDALGSFGVTNDRLDEVSNYYRYRPDSGDLWSHEDAIVEVTFEGKRVSKISVVARGSGYTSLPRIMVPGHPELKLIVTLSFGPDLLSNGSIRRVSLGK
jgi:hypothetical protein